MAASPSNEGEPDISIDEAISQAVQQNDAHTLRQLLEKRKQILVPLPADGRGWTALHLAASRPELKECLQLLLQQTDGLVDLNASTEYSKTPLQIACEEGCEENVLLLLQARRFSTLSENNFSQAFCVAASNGNLKIVEYFLGYLVDKDGEWWSSIVRALRHSYSKDHREVFRLLLQKAVRIQAPDERGNLPLHSTPVIGNLDISLLREYADLTLMNHQNHLGVTPFMYAVAGSDLPTVQYLLENGAKTDICDKKGEGVLHHATKNSTEVFQLLLQSIDSSNLKKFYLASYPFIGKNVGRTFSSLTCSAIHASSADYLDLLLTSGLPKSFLQMPCVAPDYFYAFYNIYSPIVHLFLARDINKELISYLRLLLNHKVIMVDEFFAEFPVKWPEDDVIFEHPFDKLIFGLEDDEYRQCFELLIAHGVTTDYCLQCYHDNSRSFDTFNDYDNYYDPVVSVIKKGNLEVLKLLLINSVILEPDKLLVYAIDDSNPRCPEIPGMYEYLTDLKPIYYSREVFQLCPSYEAQYFGNKVSEEFSRSTLQQLCRTTIRQQLREPSLDDNLRNFRRKILELPLPNSLKDYLLFKNWGKNDDFLS